MMNQVAKYGNCVFDYVEPKQVGQCNFLCPQGLRTETGVWLDYIFNWILQYYGVEWCQEVYQEGNYVCK